MKKFIAEYMPVFIQNLAISIYNTNLYRKRHGESYAFWRNYYNRFESATIAEIDDEQERKLAAFLDAATKKSSWYEKYKDLPLKEFPILQKEALLNNLLEISTINEKEGMVSLTGGTTGASMKVIYTHRDVQERFALLDHFRAAYGLSLGRRTAWFSGKSLVRKKDLDNGNVFRDDYINKIRFFSTFYINEKYFESYWKSFEEFSPEFIVGFPSSIYDLCTLALEKNIKFKGKVTAFFPTAETVLPIHREVITQVLGCQVVDQYASSEGAPFILECRHGSLHIHPLSGIIEVVDENLQPSVEGEMIVTSFTTHGTPLIRYRIGDRIKLAPETSVCACGSSFPMVEFIDGRTSDFIWSKENGRVNLGNISNCTKDVEGILCFQVIQSEVDSIHVKIVAGRSYDDLQENKFINALRLRVGNDMKIKIEKVANIPKEKSGKFKLVNNTLSA